jgi:anthranilate phosphoribosyltransferase
LEPEQFGINKCKKEDLVGGGPSENAEIAKAILAGEKGPKRDAVVLNTAACIYIVKDNISFKEAVKLAEDTIDSGKAMRQLEEFISLSNN